ncbi:MAG: response regulator [Hahellaceae bacterium]|nr:response regulator [Hahellaceae bacterium]
MSNHPIPTRLQVLLVDDSEDDVFITLHALKQGGFTPVSEHVDNEREMQEALERQAWDLVITDHNMPSFDAISAVRLLRKFDADVPAIILSGAIGEDTAVAAMKSGANDYVMKDNMVRLIPAINRELKDARIRREHKRIQQANLAKSLFLANMSHEIRTPMSGVLGMASLLLDTQLTAEQREYANAIQASADALLDIVNDILDISKIEAGKLELDPIAFNVRETLADIAELLSIKAHEKDLPLLLRIDPAVPRTLIGDPLRIRQILMNFLSNAIKFTQTGYVLLNVMFRPADPRPHPLMACAEPPPAAALTFAVTDTGIGIGQDKLESVFEEYIQAERSTARQYGGTGLGLTICRKLATLMGGNVSARSFPGNGSTFSLELELPIPAQKPLNMLPFAGKKLLLAATAGTATSLLVELLESRGAQIILAENEASAKAALSRHHARQQPLDALLFDSYDWLHALDSSLKQLSTEPFTTEAFATEPFATNSTLPRIYVPTIPEQGDQTHCQTLGVDGYVSHPVRPSVLQKVLLQVLTTPANSRTTVVSRFSLEHTLDSGNQPTQKPDHTVLLVEDNPINQKVAQRMLEKLGCSVVTAINGQDAVARCESTSFDLILMDCVMPVMDGYEATEQIRVQEQRQGRSRTPIIALTANAMEMDRDRCIAAGMDDHISKPVSRETLRKLLDDLPISQGQ